MGGRRGGGGGGRRAGVEYCDRFGRIPKRGANFLKKKWGFEENYICCTNTKAKYKKNTIYNTKNK